jgi:FlaA1/EpsC-like NDP-sugar epimerase
MGWSLPKGANMRFRVEDEDLRLGVPPVKEKLSRLLAPKQLPKNNLWIQLRNRHFYMMLLADGFLLVLAQIGANMLRTEDLGGLDVQLLMNLIPFIVPFKLAVFCAMGVYSGMWRYTSLEDLLRLTKAILFTTGVLLALALYANPFHGVSPFVIILDALLAVLFMGTLRIGIRQFYKAKETGTSFLHSHGSDVTANPSGGRVIIAGAGDAGERISRELLGMCRRRIRIIGFVDDDLEKQGRTLHGLPILGTSEDLGALLKKYSVDQVLIASKDGKEIRKIVGACKNCRVQYKILPSVSEILEGKVTISTLREVNYQDLIGRSPVQLDTEKISGYLTDRVVLVTGCGGSIGSELCRQIVGFKPAGIVLVDASEEKLFWMQSELQHEWRYFEGEAILGKVQNRSLMESVFRKYRPDVVFHAAACKHVPIVETNPWEAVFNNVIGSLSVMEISEEFGVDRFVLVSSDKAVRPTNVMGASKRIAELMLESLQGGGTRFLAVRFGNVVGSSGSVVQLFERQIKNGGPVTVTHPDVTRYFMTITGSGAIDPASRSDRKGRRNIRTQNGAAGSNLGYGKRFDSAFRTGRQRSHRHHVHRSSGGREAIRRIDHGGGKHRENGT